MAEPKRYAVIDANGLVVNVVLWDGESKWTPPEGCTARNVEGKSVGPGETYNKLTRTYTKAPKPLPDVLDVIP